MNLYTSEEATSLLVLFTVTLVTSFIVRYHWNRRWLYYCASKLDGPIPLPLIGSVYVFKNGYKKIYQVAVNMLQKYPPILKFWMGPELIIFNSQPEDIEILLNTHLEKSSMYRSFGEDLPINGLVSATVNMWRKHRRIISPTFNNKLLDSFAETFYRKSDALVQDLKKYCGEDFFDFLPKIWRCTLDIALESLMDSDSHSVQGKGKYLEKMTRLEEIVIIRLCNPMLYPNIIWNLTSLSKESKRLSRETYDFCKQIINLKKEDKYGEGSLRKKRFLNHLTRKMINESKEFSEKEFLDELQTILITASETTAIAQSMVMLILSIHQDVQEKIYQELHSIFDGCLRKITVDDINKMDYLERVIKETLRLYPVVPFMLRYVMKDFELNSHIYPEGSILAIPIAHLHRRKDLWDDPSSFNPDRFLPENSKKRHRCAFIPFSYGVRNCIGLRYGMMSMKFILANILRSYKVVSSTYKSIHDIHLQLYALAIKPTNGCKIKLEPRS